MAFTININMDGNIGAQAVPVERPAADIDVTSFAFAVVKTSFRKAITVT